VRPLAIAALGGLVAAGVDIVVAPSLYLRHCRTRETVAEKHTAHAEPVTESVPLPRSARR
jgi:hypothetical protein